MKFLSKKKQEKLLLNITALHITICHWDPKDPDFLEQAIKGLCEMSYLIGGIKGMEKVSRSINKWEARHEQKHE